MFNKYLTLSKWSIFQTLLSKWNSDSFSQKKGDKQETHGMWNVTELGLILDKWCSS